MIAKLHIQTGFRDNKTYLRNAYFTTPFKLADITEDMRANTLHLMLMSSSPGILDGDQYQLTIDLDTGCTVQLHTQSYQRLFNMKGAASQAMDVHLSSGSSFCFLPHPAVPHAQSVFRAANKFHLAQNCYLVFGEVLTCGRKLNGEVFLFSKFHSTTEIFISGKLMIKENLLIEPAAINLDAIGQLEGFTHQASFIYLHPTAGIKSYIELIQKFLSGQTGIMFGITTATVNGLIVRILGNKAEQLHGCLKSIAGNLPLPISSGIKPVPGVQDKGG